MRDPIENIGLLQKKINGLQPENQVLKKFDHSRMWETAPNLHGKFMQEGL